jgi:RNA polymerase sigma factor (sigma-70 family)
VSGSGVPTWEDVARDHGRFLYTVAYRLTGNSDDAQDLVQEVLLKVRKGLETYRPGSLEGWFPPTTTTPCPAPPRRRRRRPVDLLPDDPDRVLPAGPAADVALAAEVLPDNVQQALARLPEEYRTAVVLCDVVGLSYSEIGEALDVPVGTVRSRIHRGRAQLRKVLA